MRIWHISAALTLSFCACIQCSDIAFRGLDPSLEQYYRPKSGSFACLDGLKTIKYENINDNYCDCFDGSDEPGSSACVNGKFYCVNKGYTGEHLNASMVDDSYCDCCDGSDEQPGVCKNTCAEEGAAAHAALKEKAEAEAAGAKLKEAYVAQAKETRAKWAAEEAQLAKSIAAQKALADQWKVKHDAVVEQERQQREKEDEAARKEAERIARTPIDTAGQDAPDNPADTATDSPQEPAGDHITSTEPAVSGSDSAMDAADEIMKGAMKTAAEGTAQALDLPLEAVEQEADTRAMNPHEAAKQQEQQHVETDEERAKRVAAQWIREESTDAPADQHPEAEVEAVEAVEDDTVEEVVADEGSEQIPPEVPVQSGPVSWLGRLKAAVLSVLNATPFGPPVHIPDGQAVKDKYWEHHSALTDLERQQTELQNKLQLDFGPDGAFLSLHGKCFEADVDKYVYEICPYKDAVQKDGAARVSLGSWEGFREGHSAMAFTGGQHCWNGPQRSMLVSVSCGKAEHLRHVQEPSRCEYVAHLTTPAACSAEAARQLQQQVEEAERAVRAHDEL